jgi:hypothetical protein
MIMNLAAAARVVALAGLVPGACVSGVTIALTGCSLTESRDVRAYDACVARHQQELAVCEGPRQAYELDPIALQARADAVSPPVGSGYAKP